MEASIRVEINELSIFVRVDAGSEGENIKLVGGAPESHASDIAAIAQRYDVESVVVVGGSDRLKAALAAAGLEVIEPATEVVDTEQ